MIKVGIVGGTGFVAGELMRCLQHHAEAEIVFVHSHSAAGKPVYEFHEDLFDDSRLHFTDQINADIDVLFLCLGHDHARNFLEKSELDPGMKIIDLSHDFRLKPKAKFQHWQFVYGLPELNRSAIQTANAIANPGCFATAVQLALLPVVQTGIQPDFHIHAITGSTGAGGSLSPTVHFSWRNNNVSIYQPFEHCHLHEIQQSVRSLNPDFGSDIHFIPMRGNFTRGIFCSMYFKVYETQDWHQVFCEFYRDAPFVKVADKEIHLKQVINTNFCRLHLRQIGNRVLVTSVIDNMLKGAAGQAIQNMNLMFGLPESCGLGLKASYF